MVMSAFQGREAFLNWRAARACTLLVVVGCLGLLGGCTTAPVTTDEAAVEPIFPADRVLGEGVDYEADDVWDPLEGSQASLITSVILR